MRGASFASTRWGTADALQLVAGQIVTRGDTNAYAEGITLSGDDGVLVEGMLDASSGAKDFSSDSGGDVVIASANGAVTLDSKIDLRRSSAG